MGKYVGKSIKRVEDPRFIQGKGRYVANLSLPNMAHLAIKRSPYGHARIKNIDTSAAKALAGVIAVFTGQELVDGGVGALPCGWNVPDIKVPTRYPLTIDKVRHVGDGVAVVVAESPYIAADAVELIEVEYEPLPAVIDAKKAMEPGAPLVHDNLPNNLSYIWALGNKEETEQLLAAADRVVELDLVNQRLIPNAMEPRACAAQWDAQMEEMTVWTTSQNPHPIRLLLSAFTLGIPENKLRVISPDVGGGFGSKIFHYPEEIITPWVARKINRPTKWVATRSESMMTDSQGRDHVTDVRLGVTNDGTITSVYVKTWSNQGAYLSTFAPLIPTALYITLLSGLYKIKGVYGEMWGTMTNTVPVDAYRGAGRPEASYLLERIIDLAAQELNMDPLEFRRKNLIPADEFPYQTPVAFLYDSGNYQALFDKVEAMADYKKLRQEQEQARKDGRVVGIGVVGCIEASGPAPSAVAGSLGSAVGFWESGKIRVHPTGKVSVFTGSHTHGQGHETTFAQVVADELGMAVEDVEIVHGDTASIPFGMGTYGSRSAAVGGSALVKSAEKIRNKMKKIAAHQLEAAEEDIVFDQADGKLYVKGSPDRSKAFGEISFAAYTAHNLPAGLEPGLEETSFYDPANFTFPNSAHIAQVEIDKDTGEVTIQKYFAVDDVGKVINPLIVEGQIIGGIVQGVGQALWENGAYDENGQLVSGTLLDYAMPRADGFPTIQADRIETPSPHNPLGVKGAGEMGTIAGTVCIANAVMDALRPYGVRHLEMPLTAEKLYKAMHSNGGGD
ncbi:MAG: xanthine dehydrogenase family protein molybdopterin-binding subunit [Chloroflexi bacterium]|nr:xanthine dehydrogenase family protein molybdopterin-binding subunit [Chloroflexota bacterium]MCI0575709.1 xanthine dehydrogenase family protein molybdopterin-binding subunit [Chloroflexota bacterium]MCI0648051.1 xanthine dehydrogenase family protein molybdopterin-binding subunit [Chloroflexota bacterium]MCI0725804.1 xanthine dehydrogenase family protein molybdopterin-binding subunit [Chloroflexota bacterium]